MKLLIVGLVVGLLAYLPVYTFERYVLPELAELHRMYQTGESIAELASPAQ